MPYCLFNKAYLEQTKNLDIDLKNLFTEEIYQRLLTKIQNTPSDFDFRILTSNADYNLLYEFREEFKRFLLSKLPLFDRRRGKSAQALIEILRQKYKDTEGHPGRYDALSNLDPNLPRILIKEFAFTKLFVPKPNDVNML